MLKERGQELVKKFEDLCKLLIDQISDTLYINVCQGLFEDHKIIFSFLICTSIQKNVGDISEELSSLLIRGPGVYDKQ